MNGLYSTMEFSPQPENYLDEMFGLSADIFAADLGGEGSILDLDLDGVFKQHHPTQQAVQQSLEDLLLPPEPAGDPLGDDWMENVDFKSLLDSNVPPVGQALPPALPQAPVVQLPPPSPPVATPANQMITFTTSKGVEPRKEGMKIAAFELLKALLTDGQALKNELEYPLKNEVAIAKVEPVTTISLAPPSPVEPVHSPVAEVPNIDFSSIMNNTVTYDIHIEEGVDNNSFEDLIQIQPEISLDNGDIAEIKPEADSPLIASIELQDTLTKQFVHTLGSSIASPRTSEIDSVSMLSSEPSSPSNSPDLSTIDTSYFSDSSQTSSVKSSQVSENDFTKLKSKSKKSRSTPYDPDYEHVGDKKLRKKVQNKNAATRYRVKKRAEKESLQEQEVRLADKNKELREKVESLQREIKYMKELMNEINKAKKQQY